MSLYDTSCDESTFNDTYIPVPFVRYRKWDDGELRELANKFKSVSEVEDFRAVQYDGYIRNGSTPFFSRGQSKNKYDFTDLDVNQCGRLLCILDQRRNWECKTVEKKQEVRRDPRRCLIDGQDYPENYYSDIEWIKDYDSKYMEDCAYKVRQCLSWYQVSHITFVNPGCFAPIKAALDYGISVSFYDQSKVVCDYIEDKKIGVEQLSRDDLYIAPNLFFFQSIHRNNEILSTVLTRVKDVYVCDSHSFFSGCVGLKVSPYNEGYQISSTVDGIGYTSEVIFNNVVANRRYEYLNPKIVMRFKRFCFIGEEALPYMRFLLGLDINRQFEYITYGLNFPSKKLNFVGEPVLFIYGKDIACLEIIRDIDAVYSTRLRREMSSTYLMHSLKTLGVVDLNLLKNIGFGHKLRCIQNAMLVKGMVSAVYDTVMLKRGIPYLFFSPVVKQFKYFTGQEAVDGFFEKIDFCNGLTAIIFKAEGYARIGSICMHPTSFQDRQCHDHVFKIVSKMTINDDSWLVNPVSKDLSMLPWFFSKEALVNYFMSKSGQSEVTAREFAKSLDFDPRVKINGDFVFNASCHSLPFKFDYEVFLKWEADVTFSVVVMQKFDVCAFFSLGMNDSVMSFVFDGLFEARFLENHGKNYTLDCELYAQSCHPNYQVFMCVSIPGNFQDEIVLVTHDRNRPHISWALNFISFKCAIGHDIRLNSDIMDYDIGLDEPDKFEAFNEPSRIKITDDVVKLPTFSASCVKVVIDCTMQAFRRDGILPASADEMDAIVKQHYADNFDVYQ